MNPVAVHTEPLSCPVCGQRTCALRAANRSGAPSSRSDDQARPDTELEIRASERNELPADRFVHGPDAATV
ncbi:MAG: hypothetical protein CMJ83_20825 [Planctomycetes bacterium]|nr:hypothetical protein [Planctomycetota bacterium]